MIVTDENDEVPAATPLGFLFTGADPDAGETVTFSLGPNSDCEFCTFAINHMPRFGLFELELSIEIWKRLFEPEPVCHRLVPLLF